MPRLQSQYFEILIKPDCFNREGEGGHDPREDVDGLTGIYYSKLNI
jgi:hypothetical protein